MVPQVTAPALLNLNLGMLNSADALTMSSNVTTALANHPFFTNISLDALLAAEARLKESSRATTAGDHTKIPQRDADLSSVIKELTRIGFNLQLLAIDNEAHLHNVGFEFAKRRTRTKAPRPPITALGGFEVMNSAEPGVAIVSATRQATAFGYNFQYTAGDPTSEDNWIDGGTYRGCSKIQMKGLESLKRYTFRGRALGDEGAGPWSAHITIAVT